MADSHLMSLVSNPTMTHKSSGGIARLIGHKGYFFNNAADAAAVMEGRYNICRLLTGPVRPNKDFF
jgi:hypothetical protein